MKAFLVDRYGPKHPFRFADVPKPKPGVNDVLVEVYAAGVNSLDAKIRDGQFKLILPYTLPFIAGHDVAGKVIAVGAEVTKFSVGDEMYARPRDGRVGTFAQFISIHEDDVALKPSNLSFEEAASIPLVGLTAWQALVERGKLGQGQKVFIQAGSGGVGTFAIQLAKHLGATVATTTSAGNANLVQGLGADIVIDYRKVDFETVLADYDLVLNSQDTATLEKSMRILKRNGRVISISGPPDPVFAEDKGLNLPLKTVLRLLSSRIRRQARRADIGYSFLFMSASGAQLSKITTLIEAGIIKPVVDRVFPFAQTNEAMAYLEEGRAKGKVVITFR